MLHRFLRRRVYLRYMRAWLLALCGLLAPACLQAAPVTLHFEAIIGPPRAGTFPIDLPFSFTEGDRITGSFTFEPFDAPADDQQTVATQDLPLKLRIGSFGLNATGYRVIVDDDSASDEMPTPEDRIVLQSLGIGPIGGTPLYVEGAEHIEWSFSWTLNGKSQVLVGADIPESIATWNQLTPSSLLVSFHDMTNGRGTGLQATILDFQIVPEPESLTLFGVMCIITLSKFGAHSRQR